LVISLAAIQVAVSSHDHATTASRIIDTLTVIVASGAVSTPIITTALVDLSATLAIVQAAIATSRERAAGAKVVMQQEKATVTTYDRQLTAFAAPPVVHLLPNVDDTLETSTIAWLHA
jgi:hypothetical protein